MKAMQDMNEIFSKNSKEIEILKMNQTEFLEMRARCSTSVIPALRKLRQ
jgi:hypothetical protein